MLAIIFLVGNTSAIPFDFQDQLDDIHSVCRVCFDTPEEYRTYADAVVPRQRSRRGGRQSVSLLHANGISGPVRSRSLARPKRIPPHQDSVDQAQRQR